jgi:hypothetical protein
MEEDPSLPGRFLAGHIRRQRDLILSERYDRWFREIGEAAGFDQATILAAIVGSDVTKAGLFSPHARAHFGTTEEHVAALAAQNELRFGRVFSAYSPLENLYQHAEGGRHYTLLELRRRGAAALGGAAEQEAIAASEAIVGHDSFNSGFGQHKLKSLLAARHNEPLATFDYPASVTPAGFIVQVVDRLEGCDPATMLRFVEEGVGQRSEPISVAIRTGVLDNYHYLREAHARILEDARRVLSAEQARLLAESPAMQDFTAGLDRVGRILTLLAEPDLDGDGFYRLQREEEWVRLDSIEAFRMHFLPAVERG